MRFMKLRYWLEERRIAMIGRKLNAAGITADQLLQDMGGARAQIAMERMTDEQRRLIYRVMMLVVVEFNSVTDDELIEPFQILADHFRRGKDNG